MRGAEEAFAVPVVFADRFFMSDKSLAEISSVGGYAWADARDAPELAEKLANSKSVKILVSEYIRIGAPVLERAPALQGVIAYGAGYDHVDVDSASRRGVLVCNCRGENAQAVAEMTFGLLLCLLRKVHWSDRYIREDHWKRTESAALPEWVMGQELHGKTMGIVGLGQIGSRVARIARGFDMKVMAYDPLVPPQKEVPVERVSLDELLSRADIVSLHVPLTPATDKLINARGLGMMKRNAVLVNTSRGRVVDEPKLFEVLKAGKIGGAALDVFAGEPISGDHPFTKLGNVVLSPHIGAMTLEAGERLSDAVARQVRDILEGRRPECVVAG